MAGGDVRGRYETEGKRRERWVEGHWAVTAPSSFSNSWNSRRNVRNKADIWYNLRPLWQEGTVSDNDVYLSVCSSVTNIDD